MGAEEGNEEKPRTAEDLFAEFLRRSETQGIDFEAFAARHSRHAEALRALYSIHGERRRADPAPAGDTAPGPLEPLLDRFARGPGEMGGSPIEGLTDRELQVFRLIGLGRGTREIARELHISGKTVEVHRIHIKTKLNLRTMNELIRTAVHWVENEN